jgi:hypothetical protein
MGYAIPKGRYHKGPKKNTRARKFHKPTFDAPKQQTNGMSASDEALVKVIAQMDNTSMNTFIKATAHPNPTDVVIVRGANGRPKPIVLDDTDSRQTHSGMDYLAGFGGFGGAPHHVPESNPPIVGVATIKPTAVKVEPIKTETSEKVIGNIVRKPNGEIVLRFF